MMFLWRGVLIDRFLVAIDSWARGLCAREHYF
jgi:hypothetical protein